MPIHQFTAFYPSKPFWAGSAVNFGNRASKTWFHDQMVEEVFSEQLITHTIKVCRDGRIMLRVEALEQNFDPPARIEQTVKRWGEYLDYLNTLYLLLDSSTLELERTSFFNLHEITNRDAFRVTYKDGASTGESIAIESIASVFQLGRYSSSYRQDVPIELDPRIMMRHVISIKVIEHAVAQFRKVISYPGLEKTLASFAKSVSEYKIGNYETSIVLSWFIIEAAISDLWKSHLDSLNSDLPGGRKRINHERKASLTGKDATISLVSNLLELWDVLPDQLFQDVDTVRGFRNKIVHAKDFTPSAKDAQRAIEAARSLVEKIWALRVTPSLGYGVTGL